MFRRSGLKSPAQLRAMVQPGLITAASLDAVRAAIRPGITTAELDAAAERAITERGAHSNFKLVPGYHHATCISVNNQVVHGIPGDLVVQAGDIVSIDSGAETPDGWNGDSAITIVVPGPDAETVRRRQELSDVTEGSMWAGIAALASAKRTNEVGAAVEDWIHAHPLSWTGQPAGILRDYVGHGIGRKMHEAPSVFNYRAGDDGVPVKPGLAICIEPMMTAGLDDVFVEDDDWTIATVDGTDGSHWEHSVAVHDDGIWVLTSPDGGAASLAPFGVTPVPIP
ncbi:MAG: type I methionyl aminopeptidase [Microbacterium sp.]